MKILIVEDEPVSRKLLDNFLASYGECDKASDGAEALDCLRESLGQDGTRYDLICLDIMMPGMDGQTALKKIREMEKERGVSAGDQVKVIMVTALDDSENIMQALVKGKCEGYLTKPVTRVKMHEQLVELRLI